MRAARCRPPGYVIDFGGGACAPTTSGTPSVITGDRFQVDESIRARTSRNHRQQRCAGRPPERRRHVPPRTARARRTARSPMAISTGEGDALVLTDGKAITGHWKRSHGVVGWELVDQGGLPHQVDHTGRHVGSSARDRLGHPPPSRPRGRRFAPGACASRASPLRRSTRRSAGRVTVDWRP